MGMPMQELDRRTRKTRKAINDAFWKLMQEKDFEDITIQDITDAADIHRATFYLHYQDKYDWLEKTITGLLQNLIDKKANIIQAGTRSTKESFRASFQYFDENYQWYSTLLKNRGTLFFQTRFKELLIQRFAKDTNVNTPERQFAVEFVSSAIVGCIEWWIENDRPLSVDQMAENMYDIHNSFPKWMRI